MISLSKVAEYARAVKILSCSEFDKSDSDDNDEDATANVENETGPEPSSSLAAASDDSCPDMHGADDGGAEDFTVPPPGCKALTGSSTGLFEGCRRRSTKQGNSENNVFDTSTFFCEASSFAPEVYYNHRKPDTAYFSFPTVTFQDLLRSSHSAESTMHQPFEIQCVSNAKLLKRMLKRKEMSRVIRRAFYTALQDSTDQYLLGIPQFSQFIKDLNIKLNRIRPLSLYDQMVKPLPASTLGSFFLIIEALAKASTETKLSSSTADSAVHRGAAGSTEAAGAVSSDIQGLADVPQESSKSSLHYVEAFVSGPLAAYVHSFLPPWADPECHAHRRDRRLPLLLAQQRPMIHHIFEVFSQQYQSGEMRQSMSRGESIDSSARSSKNSIALGSRKSIMTPRSPQNKISTPSETPKTSRANSTKSDTERKSVTTFKDRVSIALPKEPARRSMSPGRKSEVSLDLLTSQDAALVQIAQGVNREMGFVDPADPAYFFVGSQWRRILRLQTAARTIVNFSIPGLNPADVIRLVKAAACGTPTHPFRCMTPGSGKPMPIIYLTKFLAPGEIFLIEPEFDDALLRLASLLEILHRDEITPEDAFDEAKRRVSTRKSTRFSIVPKEAEKVLIPRIDDVDINEKTVNPFTTVWKDRRVADAGSGRVYEAFVHLCSRYLSVLYSSISSASVTSALSKVNFLEVRQGLLELVPPSVIGLILISASPVTECSKEDSTATSSENSLLVSSTLSDPRVEVLEAGGHVQIFGTDFVADSVYVLLGERVSIRCAVDALPPHLVGNNKNRDGSALIRAAHFYVPSLENIFSSEKMISRQRPQREVSCVQDSTSTMRVGVSLRFDVPLMYSNDGKFWVDAAVQSREDVVRYKASFKSADSLAFFKRLPMVMIPSELVEQLLGVFRVYAEYENPSRTHLMSESKWNHFCACFFMFEYEVDIESVDCPSTVSQFVKDALAAAEWKRTHCAAVTPTVESKGSKRISDSKRAPISSLPNSFGEANVPRVSSRGIQIAFDKHATRSQRHRSTLSNAALRSKVSLSAAESPVVSGESLRCLTPPQFIAAIVDVVLSLCSKYANQEVELRYTSFTNLDHCWTTISICLFLESIRRAGVNSVHTQSALSPRPPSAGRTSTPSPHSNIGVSSAIWAVEASRITFRWISVEADLVLRQREAIRAVAAVSRSNVSHFVIHRGVRVGQIGCLESHLYPRKGEELLKNDRLLLCIAESSVTERVRQIIDLNLPYNATIHRLVTQDFHFFSLPPTIRANECSESVRLRRLWLIQSTGSNPRTIAALCNSPGQFSTLHWVPQPGMFASPAACMTAYINDDNNSDAMAISTLRDVFVARGEKIGLLRRGIEAEGFQLDPIFPPGVVDFDGE
jgi:hypothetical protein